MSFRDRPSASDFDAPDFRDDRSDRDREAARRAREQRRAVRGGTLAPPRPAAGGSDAQGGRGTARTSMPGRPSARPGDGGPPRRGGGGLPPRGGDPRGPHADAARRRRRLALALAAVGALLAIWFLAGFWSPFAGDGGDAVRVRVPQGSGVSQIADILDERGVVPSAALFSARVRLSGRGEELKPGTYTLRTGMSYSAALEQLTQGPPRNVVSVTIPEGRARGEIAPIVDSAGLDGSYLRASDSSPRLNPADYGAKSADSLEGFLFPSTYELGKGASARQLVDRQLDAFKQQFRKVNLSEARRKNLSPYEVLVIASMVEREAQLDRERPLIASVIYNRLKRGEPLGIDATTRYATKNWTRPLTQSQLATPSPYNTRTNQGLPPGPIGNPGLASIKAAANPAQTAYLFYVVKPGTCGEHAFSRTISEFNLDTQRYNSERAARGGQSPTDCQG